MSLDPRFLKGVELFNERKYFDAHEVWEDLWNEQHGEDHNFVQGLIQYATALHHFEDSNLKGAKILYEAGTKLLSPYPPLYWQMELLILINDMAVLMKDVTALSYDVLPGRYHPEKKLFPVQLKVEQIPKIILRGPHGQ